MTYSTETSQQKKDKAERSTGLGRRPREVIGNGNQMTALRFHTGGRQSRPSFGGGGGREGGGGGEAGGQKRLCINNNCGGTEIEATCKARMSDTSLPHAYRDDSWGISSTKLL